MEGESRRGRGETRRAGNISNRSRSRSTSRSADVDSRRRTDNSNSSVDGRVISSNHLTDDSDVSSIRRWRPLATRIRTASSANPATVTQRNYIAENLRTEARLRLPERREEARLRLPERSETSNARSRSRSTDSSSSSDDSDVSSIRRSRPLTARIRTASSANPATATQQNYITINVAAATENARAEAGLRLPERREEARLRLRERREEFVSDATRILGVVVLLTRIIPRGTIRDAQSIRGADRVAVQQLARVIISEQHISNDSNSDCPICRDQYQLGEAARVMQCGHMYHETCIFTWLESNRTCPLCRFEMP